MSRWGDEKTLLFITYYKEHECLWNPSSPFYKNKIARENAYMSLLNQLNDNSLTVKFIKTKIKNLRTTYHQELNKIRHCTQSGDGTSQVYKPSICWFEEMDSFLGESLQNRSTVFTEMAIQRSAESSQSKPLSTNQSDIQTLGKTAQKEPATTSNNLEQNPTSKPANNDQKTVARKPKRLVHKTLRSVKRPYNDFNSSSMGQLENVSAVINALRAGEDEFHFFGMNVAAQLRRLPLHVALQLQAEFQNRLFLASVGDPLDNTTLASTNFRPDADLSEQNDQQVNINEVILQNMKEETSPP